MQRLPRSEDRAADFIEDTAKLNDETAKYFWERARELWLQSRVLGFTFDGQDEVKDAEKRDVFVVGVSEIDAEIEDGEMHPGFDIASRDGTVRLGGIHRPIQQPKGGLQTTDKGEQAYQRPD